MWRKLSGDIFARQQGRLLVSREAASNPLNHCVWTISLDKNKLSTRTDYISYRIDRILRTLKHGVDNSWKIILYAAEFHHLKRIDKTCAASLLCSVDFACIHTHKVHVHALVQLAFSL